MDEEEEILQPEEEEEYQPEEEGEEYQPEARDQARERSYSQDRGRQRKKGQRRPRPKDTSKSRGLSGAHPPVLTTVPTKDSSKPKTLSGGTKGSVGGARPSVPQTVPAKTPVSFGGKAGKLGAHYGKKAALGATNVGWNGMKAALGSFMDDETKERLQKIENGVKGGADAIDRAINTPREIANRVRDIATLPKKVSDAIRVAKEIPQRIQQVQQILQNAKNVGDVVKAYNTAIGGASRATVATAKATATTAKATAATAKTTAATAKAAATTAKAAATTARVAVEAVKAAATTARVAVEAVKAGTTAIATAVAGAPVWLVVLVIILIFVVVMIIISFLSGQNGVSSLAGGSMVVNTPRITATELLVDKLKDKMAGCDPKLVVYEQGEGDIGWQIEEGTDRYFHKLDRRLLKTIDYLTENHRIKIELLNAGAPMYTLNNFLVGLEQFSPNPPEGVILPENWDEMTPAEQRQYLDETLTPEERRASEESYEQSTISAFATGQAMAITEIDRSDIPELQNSDRDICTGAPIPAPIAVSWQKTQSERLVRSTWEELSWIAGQLDQNKRYLHGLYIDFFGWETESDNRNSSLNRAIREYKESLVEGSRSGSQIKSLLTKINRAKELLERTRGFAGLHVDTLGHAEDALIGINKFNDWVDSHSLTDYTEVSNAFDWELAEAIGGLGSPDMIANLRQSIRNIYQMTQVANMVGWDVGDLDYRQAYESRNKIRQIIVELLQMPTKVSLSFSSSELMFDYRYQQDPSSYFDSAMAVKQIITFSPEDDLDNGQIDRNVFPAGIDSVCVEGISFNNNGIRNGPITHEDLHFSHAPIDNGVFSKATTNFVFDPTKNTIYPEVISELAVTWDKIVDADLWAIGGMIAGTSPVTNESIATISYQKFLYVAF